MSLKKVPIILAFIFAALNVTVDVPIISKLAIYFLVMDLLLSK